MIRSWVLHHSKLEKNLFYNNWPSSRGLIGWELWSIIVWPWKWSDGGAISFSFSTPCDFPRNFNRNGCQKKKLSMFPWSLLLSTICSMKTLQWNHSLAISGSAWVLKISTSFLWSIKVHITTDHGKFLSGFYLGYLRGRSSPQNAQLPSPPPPQIKNIYIHIYIVIITLYK